MPDDFIDNTVQNPVFNTTLTTTTTYTLTYTDAMGCVDDDVVVITVNPVPTVILIASPNPACIGDDITLTAIPSAGSSYRFQYNDGSGWTNFTTPGWSSVNPQTYLNIVSVTDFRVKVRQASGCTASSWSTITVPINMIVTPPISHN